MVGTISMILALNDSLIYSGEDLGSKFFGYYSAQPGRKYLCIATPKTVDLAQSRVLPCIVGGKVPMHAQDTFHPGTWGRILVSSLTNGSLSVCEVTDNSSKMPDYQGEDGKSPRTKAKKSGEGPLTFDYPYLRKELAVGTDMPARNDTYAVWAISGDILSEPQVVTVTGAAPGLTSSGSPRTTEGVSGRVEAHPEYWYAKNPLSPPPPSVAGIALSGVPHEKAERGKPFMVYGSVRLKAAPKSAVTVPVEIHILVSGTEEHDLTHYRLSIPVDMLHQDNGSLVGYFAFDCMKEFFCKQAGRFDIPKQFFITAISRDLHAGPALIATGQ